MSFVTSFSINNIVTHEDVINEFRCGNMGGMRRSRATNTLVIISDHTKGLYDDKWFGDVLHYTGMGKAGDQSIDFAQNKTLAQANFNGVDVHLFEVINPGEYIYRGIVELCQDPYQEIQKGEDGLPRKVWMYPVRLKSGEVPIEQSLFQNYEERKQRQAQKLNMTELKRRAQESNKAVSHRTVISSNYLRDQYVSEYVKKIAKGHCQLCGNRAPFYDKLSQPYLESHHIVWLSEENTRGRFFCVDMKTTM